jgi:hypothetical protein
LKNLSTALAKFASLFDSFSKKLTNLRSDKGKTIGEPWTRFWGSKEDSFDKEIDATLLAALEPYKKILTLLKEVRINRILSESALTPETKVEQAEEFKEKADIKLSELSEEIDILRQRLSITDEDENEDRLFESSRFVTNLSLDEDNPTGKFSVTEIPFKRKGDPPKPGALDSQALRSPFSASLSSTAPDKKNLGISGAASSSLAATPLNSKSSSITDKESVVEQLATLEYDILELRNYLEDKNDLKIKTAKGVKALSLPFYLLQDLEGKDRVIIDLEGIIELHNKAIRAVTEAWAKTKDMEKVQPLIQRVQKYLLALYENMRSKINLSADNMPSTRGEIPADMFLQLEACANLSQWQSIEDIEEFRDIFIESIDEPFNKFIKEPDNRLFYLKSIVNG